MTNTFDEIQDRSKLESLRVRAGIILDEQLFLSRASITSSHHFPNWLQVVLPKGRHTAAAPSEHASHAPHGDPALHAGTGRDEQRLAALEGELARLATLSSELKSQTGHIAQDLQLVLELLHQLRGAGSEHLTHL